MLVRSGVMSPFFSPRRWRTRRPGRETLSQETGFLAAFGLLSIFIPFADGVCRKDPWNWEYDCAESNVAAKKALMEKEAAEANQ